MKELLKRAVSSSGSMSGTDLSGLGMAVGSSVGALLPKTNKDYNIASDLMTESSSDLGFGTDSQSAAFAEKLAKRDAKNKAAAGALNAAASASMMIPGVGWIASGALGLTAGLLGSGAFNSKKKEEAWKRDDDRAIERKYNQLVGKEAKKASQDVLGDNIYAGGGQVQDFSKYSDDYLNLFGLSRSYAYGGLVPKGSPQDIMSVNVGGTHEENPQDGVTFGYDQNGTPNKAEEGEVIVDLPSGQFVFTSRF